jgi:starch synthase (maltosyl-transferring)
MPTNPVIPIMWPAPGERLLRFVGDRLRFELKDRSGRKPAGRWRARLRTNLGRAEVLRQEIIQAHARGVPLAGESWRDLPMPAERDGWTIELPLTEPGFFKAKAYLLDENDWQHWPEGADVGISVHPDAYRTANTIYCAFPRLFGATKTAVSTRNERLEQQIAEIEKTGFTIIPPSGKLRDLIQCLPHIIDTLGCRMLHLLPIHPTPATYARFGNFGSPYAALDFTAIDPALVVFDKRTTGIDQFRELTYATHLRGARVMIDIVINHTGWGSKLQEEHPEWFLRTSDGEFACPGAWGVVWEDLVELKHNNVALWDQLADMFLIWCRRGVDGFRCDAGYKVPVPAWQYIIARVQQEFPGTLFLLEGLGGAWETTETLLTDGGMQWAYSELFQNYSGRQVADYLDYALSQSRRVGVYVHYSETHDNERLAVKGRNWSLLRNRLCALTSPNGGFGFTCGAEWLATEKIRVHGSTGLAWGAAENLIPEIARLNRLLLDHPCFFDGAQLTRLSAPDSPVYALLRESAEGTDAVLVLVNNDTEKEQAVVLSKFKSEISNLKFDLLNQPLPAVNGNTVRLAPGASCCLAETPQPRGLSGEAYRHLRAQAAWALQALAERFSVADIGACNWIELAKCVESSPAQFLAAIAGLEVAGVKSDLAAALRQTLSEITYSNVVVWSPSDRARITLVPPGHWLLVEDSVRFRASLEPAAGTADSPRHLESIAVGSRYIASFPPRNHPGDATLSLERYTKSDPYVDGAIRFLPATPPDAPVEIPNPRPDDVVLLTNGIGGMARMCVDLGRVKSKYDCVLGANLHPTLPVDRHVFVKRVRVWVNADGFLSPLDIQGLGSFRAGPVATWNFVANAGDGRTVEVEMRAEMVEGRNTTVLHFCRPTAARATGKQLPADADVRLTVRVDIEDRSFHSQTKRNSGTEHHFATHTSELRGPNFELRNGCGFAFTPAADRQLRVFADSGVYHPQPEWSENIAHPWEQNRGHEGSGDAYSPGWFELPLPKGSSVALVATAESEISATTNLKLESAHHAETFGRELHQAARAFVVRRGAGKTVIAGYPWFLDWGRDTFISARGLLAAGLAEEVKQILVTFARFEENGTLPNTINGEDASNRDTSDAPLWFALVCEEVASNDPHFYAMKVGDSGRTIRDVLESIASHYMTGTPNGIWMDPDSALIWSPKHFTWMDTNYPAATPREGYPIEIQALWIRLLRHVASIKAGERKKWLELAGRALASVERLFWMEDRGWYADLLMAGPGNRAGGALASDALRSNCLFLVSLGLVSGERARRCVNAALRHLVVPGALRSLAPLPVSVPLPVHGNDGGLLNDPVRPYWSRYEGDEDSRRKPAYHNGTAWTWTFPVFCEALAMASDWSPEAVAAARAYLGSMATLMQEGCLGQIPEILDGDAPHTPRGCDAQAWGVTEALRVWKLLGSRDG